MFAYIHKRCGKPAWLLRQEPIPGQRFLSQQCYTFGGLPLVFTNGCRCLSCGELMFEDAARKPETAVIRVSMKTVKQLQRKNSGIQCAIADIRYVKCAFT